MDEIVKQKLVHLWNYPSSFEYIPGVTSFSDWRIPATISTIYLIVIFTLYQIMKNRERMELKYISAVHNFNMFALSVICFIGMTYGIIIQSINSGVETLFCDSKNVARGKGTLTFWMYIFYLTKFYELFDTVILALRRSQLRFLHIYHHFATGPLCFICLHFAIPVQWIATTLNAFVHIPMYWYYFLVIFKISPWWKKYITKIQIIQFIINLIVYNSTYLYHHLIAKNCNGYNGWGSLLASGIIWSYLFLFVDFYRKSYTQVNKKKNN